MNPDEIISILKEEIKNYDEISKDQEVGTVISVGDGIATVHGIDHAMYGEVVTFENGLKGMVQDIRANSIGCILFGKDTGIKEGTKVARTQKQAGVPVGDAFIGRIVNALGAPIDGKGEIKADGYRPVENPAPGIIDRKSVTVPLETGILSIDSMFPIGRGQRELIIGDRQTGKTSVALDTILNQKGKDVICIYVAIGQKASTVAKIVSTLENKFIWLQGREVWMFSMLYNKVEKRKEWLDCAVQGGDFLKRYGHDGDYNWYFSLDRSGRPLVEPYNIFSYTFAAMAFGQLSLATGNQEYADIAKKTFDIILSKVDNPKGKWNKLHPGTRNLKNFALPMILCNLAMEIEHILGKDYLEQAMDTCIHEVMSVFYRPELGGIIVENVDVNGNLIDCFEGRQITPGHAIEAMWFIMDLGKRLNRPELIEKAKNITLTMLEYGWDKEYGGIYYFMDRNGCPPQQLEWDQKLWWVHIETLISLLKSYQLTGDNQCLEWFEKVHDYTWTHFKDKEHPEWYGYLNRRGEVLLPLKGGKWKGCFHVPRGLYQCWKVLEQL